MMKRMIHINELRGGDLGSKEYVSYNYIQFISTYTGVDSGDTTPVILDALPPVKISLKENFSYPHNTKTQAKYYT